MEINERFVTVLTPEGEFIRTSKLSRNYQIGQEIDFFPAGQEVRKKRLSIFRSFKGKALAASIACLFLLVSLIPFYQNNQVYAYVSIDINPSVELVINKDYEVIELIPYNKDGEKIVNQLRGWKRKAIDEVTKIIIAEIERQGYLKNQHEIVVGMVYKAESMPFDDPQWKGKWADVQEVIQEEHLDLMVVEGTTTDREKAQDKGVTIGEYKEALVKGNKKQSVNKQNQSEKQVEESQPKEELPAVEPHLVEDVQEEAEESQHIHPSVVSPKSGIVEPAIESKPLSPPGQVKKDSSLDVPAWDDKEKGPDSAHSSEKEKKPEHTETNAGKMKQQNNGNNNNNNNGNNKHNNNNGNNGNNGKNNNQGKQKEIQHNEKN